jgi:hypothetical protein
VTLNDLARQTWESGATSLEDVIHQMRRALSSDRELYVELLEPIILRALRHAAMEAMYHERAAIVSSRRPSSQPSASLIDGIKQIAERNLLDFRLSGGKRLGDCTGAEVSADADARQVRINTEMTRVRWLRLVAKALSTPTVVVGIELDHNKLDALLAQAENGSRVEVAA